MFMPVAPGFLRQSTDTTIPGADLLIGGPVPIGGAAPIIPFLAALLSRFRGGSLRTVPKFASELPLNSPSGRLVVGRGDDFIGNIPFQNPGQLAHRGAQTLITPREFFRLTGKPATESAPGIERAMRSGDRFANPSLFLDPSRNGLRVATEEGRNRMIAVGNILGKDTPVPTNLFLQGGRRAEDFVRDNVVVRGLESGKLLPREGIKGGSVDLSRDVFLSEQSPRVRAILRELGLD